MKLKLCLAAALSCVVGLACAQSMPKEINIAYVKAPFNLQNMVMKDQNLLEKAFEKHGTKVKWHTITSGAKQTQAMAAGALDFSAVMNTASLLSTNGAGNPVLIANGVSMYVYRFENASVGCFSSSQWIFVTGHHLTRRISCS